MALTIIHYCLRPIRPRASAARYMSRVGLAMPLTPAMRTQGVAAKRISVTSEEQNFDLAKLIFIRVWYVYADQINLI